MRPSRPHELSWTSVDTAWRSTDQEVGGSSPSGRASDETQCYWWRFRITQPADSRQLRRSLVWPADRIEWKDDLPQLATLTRGGHTAIPITCYNHRHPTGSSDE